MDDRIALFASVARRNVHSRQLLLEDIQRAEN
jgi:hypothetical protein